jgi:hypothetical protein
MNMKKLFTMSIAALLRQSVYSRPSGHEDASDAERLSVDHVIIKGYMGNVSLFKV